MPGEHAGATEARAEEHRRLDHCRPGGAPGAALTALCPSQTGLQRADCDVAAILSAWFEARVSSLKNEFPKPALGRATTKLRLATVAWRENR
jgi:inhibitor of KinA sporulation pathway (predicted exonuclease)